MIFSGAVFVLLAYIFKLKQGAFEVSEDPWAQKDARDFLEYLHYEYKDFARHGGFLMMNMLELTMLAAGGSTPEN